MTDYGSQTYSENDLLVLILLSKGSDTDAIPPILAGMGAASVMCSTTEKLCSEIAKGAGALLLEEEVISPSSLGCLRGVLDSQPAWSELPIIVLLRRSTETQAAQDAMLLRGDVTLVERPVRANTLLTVVRSALGNRQRQYLVRQQLRVLEETTDSLKRAETKYHSLFDSIDEGFCIIEMIFAENDRPVDFRFLEINPSFERQSGITNAQGKRMRELAPHHDEHWFQIYGKIALTGQSVRFDSFAAALNRWFDVFAFRLGAPDKRQVAILFSDITERKHTEDALKGMQEQLQLITDQMVAGVYHCSRERRYLWVSPAYARWLGRLPDEMIGRTVEEIVGRESYEVLNPYIQQVLTGERVRFEAKIKYRGKLQWITAIYTPIQEEDNLPNGWVAVVTDITETKELELALQQAKELLEKRVAERTAELDSTVIQLREEIVERKKTEHALKEESRQLSIALQELQEKEQLLIQQSRTAAMGEMLGFIGHQWRQPLNSLGLIIQELSISFEMGDLTQEHLDWSTGNAMQIIRHMSQTIDDFRNFFKSNKEKVRFKINDVLLKTIKLAEVSFFQELDLPMDITGQEDDVVAEGYPNEYSQVILNILHNARDAALERKVEQPRISIRIFKEKEKAVMTIADNAGGIPEKNLDKLFDSYFTTKDPDKGTGIGLFISKIIIEKNMGGSLTVRNIGDGAEFRIEV